METPTWLRDHADPGIRDRIAPLKFPGGNELRQTGDVEEQKRDLDAAFEKLAARHRSDEYRSVEEAEIMARKNFAATGAVPRRGPAPSPRPARVLEPAGVQHVPQPAAARLGARRRRRARHRRRPRPQPRHGRVLLGRRAPAADLLRPARRHRARARAGARSDRPRRRRPARRVRLPARPQPQPRRPRPVVGPGPGGRHPRRVPRRRHRRPHRRQPIQQRAARSRPTSTAARRTSAPSTTWASPTRRCWPSPP